MKTKAEIETAVVDLLKTRSELQEKSHAYSFVFIAVIDRQLEMLRWVLGKQAE